jgi:O-antigen/teichoic acid export membrane protein
MADLANPSQPEYSRRRTLGSATWATAQQFVTLGATALSGVILARVLSVAEFGVFSYATSLAAMGMVIVTAGLSGLAIKVLVSGEGKQARTVTALLITREFFAIIAYLGLLALSLTAGDQAVVAATAIALIVLVARAFDATEYWFQARVQSGKTAPVRIAVVLVMLAIRVLAAVLGADLQIFLLLYVAEAVVTSAALLARYLCDRESPGLGKYELATSKSLLSSSWLLMLSGIAGQINTRGGIIIVQVLLGSASVGVYSAAARLSELFYFLPVVFMTATFPRLLQIRRKNGKDSAAYRRELQRSYDQAFWAGVAIATVVFLVGPFVITVLYGDRYAGAGEILQIHVLSLPLVFMAAVFSKWIIAENLLVASLTRHAFGAVLNLALNFLLIPMMGITGAAYAALVSYCVASYLSCFVSKSTRPAGVQMTLAVMAPGRLAWHQYKKFRSRGNEIE